MPIKNREDAVEVEDRIKSFFDAEPDRRASELRALFVEVLDFDPAIGQVSLAGGTGNAELPAAADRIANKDGVHVLYISLSAERTDRVRKAEASVAAKLIADQLGDDLLLVFTNRAADQLHLILPTFEGRRPTLRRMIIERDLPRRTAVQQVSNIYWNIRDGAVIREALNDAFNVERVTDEFFKEYKQVFDVAMERTQGFRDGDDETERKKFFVQTLFNRLMFIYFLSRKGWLAFQGNKDYLKALWDDYRSTAGENKNFYIDRLRLLFFAGLNNYRSEDLTSEPESRRLIGEPPFLNGGLFDMTDLDTRSNVIIPDECISDILVKLFDRFNFTVMESTPFDIEVAVDPEMLGKVFEELVTGRHDSGSYYTPRRAVSFMCREALKGYLGGKSLGLSAEAIAKFVDEHDASGITLAVAHSVGNALARITVVDPACGSGAYLLGMMQELVDLHTVLYNVGVDSKSLYELKLGIIQRNLYGVDIDEFAVNIAMLRLWLSLSIEYEGEKPEPLPNLDFKIVCGDSLLGPDPSPENYGDLFRHQVRIVADRLADLKDKHMRESGPEKAALKEQVEDVEDELREALADSPTDHEAVDWRVQFAEVFNRGGFDVAIANPPYVRFQKIPTSYKKKLKPLFDDATSGQSDLFCHFYVRALQLLCRNGLHIFICSNSWLDVAYGAKLQKYMLNNAHIHAIYESLIQRQFSTAAINTIISVIHKIPGSDMSKTHFVAMRAPFDAALTDPKKRRDVSIARVELIRSGTTGPDHAGQPRYTGDKWGAKYLRAPDIYHVVTTKAREKIISLGDIATINRGIITGANKFFFLTDRDIKEYGVESEYLSPVMTTPQESRRLAITPSTLPYRLFTCDRVKTSLSGTGALRYIQWGESQAFHRKTAPAARKLWYSLKPTKARMAINIFIGSTARTVLASEELAFSDNFQVINSSRVSLSRLCMSLNSSFCQLILNVQGRANFGQGVLEVQTYEMQKLLIVNPDLLPQPHDEIFTRAAWDVLHPSAERLQLDDAVFDIIGLTVGERESVYEAIVELVNNRGQKAGSV